MALPPLANLPPRLGDVARFFASYWTGLPKQDGVPARAALDMGAMRSILPCFMIWEAKGLHDARWRLVGSGIREWFGMELTGRPVIDIHTPASRPKAVAAARAMIALPCGSWGLMSLRSPQGYDFVVEILCLPLRAADGSLSMFANTMERIRDHRHFDSIAAAGARAISFAEHRFIDIGAGIPDARRLRNAD